MKMQLKDQNLGEKDVDPNGSIDHSKNQDHCENKLQSDKISNGLEIPQFQSVTEASRDILEALKRSTVTNDMPDCYPNMQEVYPGLFVGNEDAAFDKLLLKDSGITHVLNVAHDQGPDNVDLDELHYADLNIIFLGIKLLDSPRVRIYQFFRTAVAFIHQALSDGGKVLIHSKQGTSRASTFACCYLMMMKQQTVMESLLHISQFRTVMPNRGFISQLLELQWRQASFLRELEDFPRTDTEEPLETPRVRKEAEIEIKRINGFKQSIQTKVPEKHREEQIVNGTDKLLNYITNGVDGSVDLSVCKPKKEENSKEMPENGIYKDKTHDFSTTKEVLAAIESVPVSQEKLNKAKSHDPDMDEIYPGLYIGNKYAALNKNFLKENGITYIVNAALGDGFSFVDTNEQYYQDLNISFLGLRIPNSPYVRIFHIFAKAYAFIDGCLNSGGKLLVHSMEGISRATAIACSYIMIKENQSVKDSLLSISKSRVAHPNQGFISQLCELEWRMDSLFRGRGISEFHWTQSQNGTESGMTVAKDLTEVKTEPSLQMKPCQETGQSKESYGNEENSRSGATKGPQSHISTVTEIIRNLKSVAIKNNISETVVSTKPEIEEVYPGLYVGNQFAALDKAFLSHNRITHILNAACGKGSDFVDTSEHYYSDSGLDFLGLKLQDSPSIRIFQFFKPTFSFIKKALGNGGKVLIHSKNGISRAPTFACSYVMLTEQRSCIDSLNSICINKAFLPNRGFISQLIELDRRKKSILSDSLNSYVDEVKINIEKHLDKDNPLSEECKEGIALKAPSWEEHENITCKVNSFNENQVVQIDITNNFKQIHVPDSKTINGFEKMEDNMAIINPSSNWTENCMWEVIS